MRKWLPLLAVSLGIFMLLIDVTIVNVALPAMATSLGASFSELQWVVDIYALSLASLLLGIGSLADLFGRRGVYILGLAVFAISSAVCGAAPNPTVLIAARAVQGIGAAAMFATTIALLNVTYKGKDLGIAFGVYGAVVGAAAAAGPILGGILTQSLSWRWVFFVNLPISIAAIVLTLRVFTNDRRAAGAARVHMDVPGILTFTVAASVITFALIRGEDVGWTSAQTLGLVAVGVVSLIAFTRIELRSKRPMLDLQLLKVGSFTGVVVGVGLLSAAAFSYFAYTSLWLQSVRNLSPIQTGLVFLPLSLAAFFVSLGIGRHLQALNPRWVISGGLLLISIGTFLQSRLNSHSSWSALSIGLLFVGVGVGFANPSLLSTGMASVPQERSGMASGAVNTGRQLGLALGLAALGVVFQHQLRSSLSGSSAIANPHSAAHAITGGESQALLHAAPAQTHAALANAIDTAFASGLHTTYLFATALGLLATAIVVATVRKPAPQTWGNKPTVAHAGPGAAAGTPAREPAEVA
jgi:EmrB/QacA subfamily drug resistance transporter